MSEAEVQALFSDIDFSTQLDQFAGIVSYAGWRYLYGCVLYSQQEAVRRWGYDADSECDR